MFIAAATGRQWIDALHPHGSVGHYADVGHYPSVCVVELAPLGARDDLEKAWRVLRRKTDWLI